MGESFIATHMAEFTYVGLFILLIGCGLGIPLPEDIILFTAGYFVYKGVMNLPMSISVAIIGIILGDLMIFYAGKKFGRKILRAKIFLIKIMTLQRLLKAKRFLKKRGNLTIFIGRFLPGLRAPIFFTSGLMGVKPSVFITLDGIATFISAPVLLYLAYYFGEELDRLKTYLLKFQLYVLLGGGVIVIAFILYKWKKKSEKKKEKEELLEEIKSSKSQ